LSHPFSQLTPAHLNQLVLQAKQEALFGDLPNYVPLLAQADRQTLSVGVHRRGHPPLIAGDSSAHFVLMSVIKPFVLLFLLETLGPDRVFQHVGMQPSEQAFHSLTQLAADRGFPRNPMINSGAIVLANLLPGEDGAARCEHLRQWLNQQLAAQGSPPEGGQLQLDHEMLASVRLLGNESNRALATMLKQSGHLEDIAKALDTYNHLCCLAGTVVEAAALGALLALPQDAIQRHHQGIVNSLMLTCGLYEASGELAVRLGMPTKSGVSGLMVAIVPGVGAIACYSPPIDHIGNSVAGLWLLETLAQDFGLNIFQGQGSAAVCEASPLENR
jgi:glutaminase